MPSPLVNDPTPETKLYINERADSARNQAIGILAFVGLVLSIATAIGAFASARNYIDQEINKYHLDELKRRAEAAVRAAEADAGKIHEILQKSGSVESHLTGLDQTASALQTHVAALDQTASAIQTRLTALDQTGSALQSRVTALDQTASTFQSSISSLERGAAADKRAREERIAWLQARIKDDETPHKQASPEYRKILSFDLSARTAELQALRQRESQQP